MHLPNTIGHRGCLGRPVRRCSPVLHQASGPTRRWAGAASAHRRSRALPASGLPCRGCGGRARAPGRDGRAAALGHGHGRGDDGQAETPIRLPCSAPTSVVPSPRPARTSLASARLAHRGTRSRISRASTTPFWTPIRRPAWSSGWTSPSSAAHLARGLVDLVDELRSALSDAGATVPAPEVAA